MVEQEVALEAADIVVLLADHKPFKNISSDRINFDYLVDSRGVWSGVIGQ